jgi:hypothetical protein
VSTDWSAANGPLVFCAYIDGPGEPGIGLAGRLLFTPSKPRPTITPPPHKPQPKYQMTLANIRGWARSAVLDALYRGRSARLDAFAVRSCRKLGY